MMLCVLHVNRFVTIRKVHDSNSSRLHKENNAHSSDTEGAGVPISTRESRWSRVPCPWHGFGPSRPRFLRGRQPHALEWSSIRPSLSYFVDWTCILRRVGVDASVHHAMPPWTRVDVFTIELTCSSVRNPRKGYVVGEPRSPRGIRMTVDRSTGGISLRRSHPGIPFPRPSPLPPASPRHPLHLPTRHPFVSPTFPLRYR